MPEQDQAQRLAAAAQHALDRGYQVTAVAPAAAALRMVLEGHADLVVVASLDDLPEIEVAAVPAPAVPRPRAAPDDVPASRRRPRRRPPGATPDAAGER